MGWPGVPRGCGLARCRAWSCWLIFTPWLICAASPDDGRACTTQYPAVPATATAATAATAGNMAAGDQRRASMEPVTAVARARMAARNPSRMIGCSIHRQDAAASPMASAVSPSQSSGLSDCCLRAAAVSAMTGQCHRYMP